MKTKILLFISLLILSVKFDCKAVESFYQGYEELTVGDFELFFINVHHEERKKQIEQLLFDMQTELGNIICNNIEVTQQFKNLLNIILDCPELDLKLVKKFCLRTGIITLRKDILDFVLEKNPTLYSEIIFQFIDIIIRGRKQCMEIDEPSSSYTGRLSLEERFVQAEKIMESLISHYGDEFIELFQEIDSEFYRLLFDAQNLQTIKGIFTNAKRIVIAMPIAPAA